MTDVQDHYETLLADHYTWMFGVSFADKVVEQATLLKRAGVDDPGFAIDLGCGSGFQTFALVELGAKPVVAIDSSRKLLDELETHIGQQDIRPVCADMLAFALHADAAPNIIICMGDSLTHLPNLTAVHTLFDEVSRVLLPGGRFFISYRDLQSLPEGVDRFIPLQSTEDRIMTCFLEAAGDKVKVHDLIHVRTEGQWALHKSANEKLVLPLSNIKAELSKRGLDVTFEETVRGLSVLSAERQ